MKTIPIPSLSKVPFDVTDKGEVLSGRGKIPMMSFKDGRDAFGTRYRDWLTFKHSKPVIPILHIRKKIDS